jgi:predicted metal-dependent hydrolase
MQTAAPHYTEEHIVAYPIEYIAGIDLYNAGEYHAAHDAWEERWMGPVAPDEKRFIICRLAGPELRGECT